MYDEIGMGESTIATIQNATHVRKSLRKLRVCS